MPSSLLCFCLVDAGKSQVWTDHWGSRYGRTGCWINRHGHSDNHDRWQKWSLTKVHQERGKPLLSTPHGHGHDCWLTLIPWTHSPAGSLFSTSKPSFVERRWCFARIVFYIFIFFFKWKVPEHYDSKALNLVKVHKKITFNAKVPLS